MLTIENFFSSLEGAYAPNTIRSYRSDYMHYSNWCQEYQYDPQNIHEYLVDRIDIPDTSWNNAYNLTYKIVWYWVRKHPLKKKRNFRLLTL